MASDLFHALIAEFGKVIAPLRAAAEDPQRLEAVLAQVGATSGAPGGDPLAAAIGAVAQLADRTQQLDSEASPSFATLAALLESLRNVALALRALSEADGPAAALETLGRDLIDWLILRYLWNYHPLAYGVAVLTTLITPAAATAPRPAIVSGGAMTRRPFQQEQFRFDRLKLLFTDPVTVLKAVYGTPLATVADANAMADLLFPPLVRVLRGLGVACRYGFDPADAALLGDAARFVDHSLIIYTADLLLDAEVEAGVVVTLSAADRGDLGFVFNPFGTLTETRDLGDWTVEFDLTAAVQGFAVGRHGFTLSADPSLAEVGGKITATLAAPDDKPAFRVGAPTGTRLEIGGAQLSAQTTLSETQQILAASAAVSKSALVVQSADGDSFLRSVLPQDGLRADFDLGIAWSSQTGLSFHGAASLDATLPVGISIGGVLKVPSIHLGLFVNDDALQAEVSASVSLTIGPVLAVVDRLGVVANLGFPDGGGNLGPVDLDFAFKPPSGVGLAVDAAGVSGGGFLAFDPPNGKYAGVLQLQFNALALQAFGLITTKVAGGQGYSLLALIDADFPPIQLGWGFTLNGVGGLLAVHRTASTDALRAAVIGGKLNFLFPKSAITDGPQILAQLDAVFPTAPGRFLFGPMALIGWGTPTVLTIAIAVILELPEPVRIVLLAKLEAKLPSASAPLIRINMDAVGVLELTQGRLSLDASLYDSKLITYALAGDMALRAAWVGNREFVLAIGGCHPRFAPPPDLPVLKRVSVDMSSGGVSKLRLAAYLALTSNTVQFGAQLDVFVGVSGYGLSGHLGFDALLQLEPFHFDADISGSVALTADGDDLMSVALDATLSGPAPWNIAGEFKIHIVFFDVGISFSETWGEEAPPPQTTTVDVGALLDASLADPRSWSAPLPAGLSRLVAIRDIQDPSAVIAHPLARLEVHERTVPLGLTIERFGDAVPSGATAFSITALQVGAATADFDPLQDDFAPGQFFNLSDAEKLARPSFERHDAGAVMRGDLVAHGASLTKTTDFETFYIDTPGGAVRVESGVPPAFPWGDVHARLFGAAGAARTIGQAGARRYAAPGSPVRVAEPAFAVADVTTLAAGGASAAGGTTYSDMRAALDATLASAPGQRGRLQIVASHELRAA
ncbi:DUF6603 domain-containing protein [Phenylobacterium sp.]|uniref:DUF6603 domain-containing protein n=1 Tax=Phenylobacterium sp. TaxID=1871053 RepID=UPI0025FF98A1|nr:DUF6603 domain-containing protein [Phenylobacterium sp.]